MKNLLKWALTAAFALAMGFPTAALALGNIPPTASDRTITGDEDTPLSFTAADFGFQDQDAGDTLAGVIVTPGYGHGRLTFQNSDVGYEQWIAVEALPDLHYVPEGNDSGTSRYRFQFKVSDGNATSNINPAVNKANFSTIMA